MIHHRFAPRGLGTVVEAVVLLGALSSCGDERATQDFYVEPSIPENPIVQTQAAAAEVADREALPPTSSIVPVRGSGISGEITITPVGDELRLEIRVEGLSQRLGHPAHVHRGVCAEGGPVVAPLSPVADEDGGSGVSYTVLSVVSLPVTEPLFVQIHGATGAPVACGDLVEQ